MDSDNDVLLNEYARTAKGLQDGNELSPERLNRFHGMTGLMLVSVYKRLWSEDALRDMMRGMIQQHASECPHHAAPQVQPPAAPVPPREAFAREIIANTRTIIICATIIVTVATMWQQLPQLGDMLSRVRTEARKTVASDVGAAASEMK